MTRRSRHVVSMITVVVVPLIAVSAIAQESEFLEVETQLQITEAPIEKLVTSLDVVYAKEHFWTGLDLSPVDAALQAQLDLGEDEGVIVTGVESGSPADEAGVQPHDLLLTVEGAAVTDSDTFLSKIQAAGEPATIVLLRGGKRLSIELTPRLREWDVVTYFVTDQYRIGVGVADVDESLRSQLGLETGRGLVVTEIQNGSPATEAGIEVHDILVEFGGKPLATVDDLTSQIQEVGDRPATMVLIRRGSENRVRVTPTVETAQRLNLNWVEADVLAYGELVTDWDGEAIVELTAEGPQEPGTKEQLEQLIQEMQDLTERMEALQRLILSEAADAAGGGDDESAGAGEGE